MSERDRPIPESYWVEPGRFLAGEFPGQDYGKLLRRRLDIFLDFGIDSFIDLTDPDELPTYLPLLKEQAGYYDIKVHYRRFTIRDRSVPPSETMQAILDEIDSVLSAGRKVYLHCWGGIGRTGTVVGCYLVRHGMTGQTALDEIVRQHGRAQEPRLAPHARDEGADGVYFELG